jgi:hypothetical protein
MRIASVGTKARKMSSAEWHFGDEEDAFAEPGGRGMFVYGGATAEWPTCRKFPMVHQSSRMIV